MESLQSGFLMDSRSWECKQTRQASAGWLRARTRVCARACWFERHQAGEERGASGLQRQSWGDSVGTRNRPHNHLSARAGVLDFHIYRPVCSRPDLSQPPPQVPRLAAWNLTLMSSFCSTVVCDSALQCLTYKGIGLDGYKTFPKLGHWKLLFWTCQSHWLFWLF